MSQTSIDRTILINKVLPKSWKCPHCGKRQTFAEYDEEILMRYGRFIRHCEQCGYLHSWELQLTDDFKRKVAEMAVSMAEPVIRCKDCKHKNEYGYCTLYLNFHHLTADMDYCSDAERKEE